MDKEIVVYEEKDNYINCSVTLGDIIRIYGNSKLITDNATKLGEFLIEEYFRAIEEENLEDTTFQEFLYYYKKDNRDFELLNKMKFITEYNKDLDKYYNEENEEKQNDIYKQLYNKYGTDKSCPHCKSKLLKSDLLDYEYLCVKCDENFYSIEIK